MDGSLTELDGLRTREMPAENASICGGHSYQHPVDKGLVWNAKG